MSDDAKPGMVKETVEAIAVIVKEVPIYQDAVQPAAREAGRLAAAPLSLLNTALRPVKSILLGVNLAFDSLDAKLRELLADVPPAKVVEPPVNVSGPLLLAYPFAEGEPPLREMFARLLATAMNSDTRADAHPSFVEIIKQLTADEARLLKIFEARRDSAVACGRIDVMTTGAYEMCGTVADIDSAPLVNPSRLEEYLVNIDRLGLLTVQFQSSLYGMEETYAALEEKPLAQKVRMSLQPGQKLKLTPGALSTTEFGKAFLRACVADKPAS